MSACAARLWVGAAVATLQDLVLPRMRGTAGATYILGTSLVGLALGPYWAGKVAALTGDLATGVFSLFVVPPFTLAALWIASRRIGEIEATRDERAAAARLGGDQSVRPQRTQDGRDRRAAFQVHSRPARDIRNGRLRRSKDLLPCPAAISKHGFRSTSPAR